MPQPAYLLHNGRAMQSELWRGAKLVPTEVHISLTTQDEANV